ncbi:MAG: tRNA pseudouridine(55) synthase TruB [Aestuariivita sp.]|nr:tRNA pseudouridine(55) synthase TruB [Aestuariivita sp.]
MSRNTKEKDVDGWIVIDKPEGITSTSTVNRVRRALTAKKAGHAGTLDPEATGVLAIALGEATKTIQYVTDDLKAYAFTIRLGQATDTDDATGRIIATSKSRPSDSEIRAILECFIGNIQQVPPKFSAIRVNGQRAYHLARRGKNPYLTARSLWVESLIMANRQDNDHIDLEMTCGKGGYVRAIARDLGEKLGCFGHVCRLRRLWSGPFSLKTALHLSSIDKLDKGLILENYRLPTEVALLRLRELKCTAEGAIKLQNGNPAAINTDRLKFGEQCWASFEGQIVAIGKFMNGELHPVRVFQKPT